MDRIKKYQNLIVNLLEEYASVKPANLSNQEYQIIADTQRNHFQLVSMGWQQDRFFYNVILHLDIKTGDKIWLQVNNTDWNIVNSLLENGVPSSQIVLGFVSPSLRQYSQFAVA
jgi:XisI protein